jgi:hypothetical protein
MHACVLQRTSPGVQLMACLCSLCAPLAGDDGGGPQDTEFPYESQHSSKYMYEHLFSGTSLFLAPSACPPMRLRPEGQLGIAHPRGGSMYFWQAARPASRAQLDPMPAHRGLSHQRWCRVPCAARRHEHHLCLPHFRRQVAPPPPTTTTSTTTSPSPIPPTTTTTITTTTCTPVFLSRPPPHTVPTEQASPAPLEAAARCGLLADWAAAPTA